MIETIWDLTLQQLTKLTNNQNLTTKPLQIHNGTNASLRTKRPNIFFKSFSSPIHLLTKCWQPTGSQNFELWKGVGMNQPGNWVQIRIREVGVWKNIYCNCIAGAGDHFSFPRTEHTKKPWKSSWLMEKGLHFLCQVGHFCLRDPPGSQEGQEVMC